MFPNHNPKVPQAEPDLVGSHGKAWRVDNARVAKATGRDPAKYPWCDSYVVYAPYSHPIWPCYLITIMSLTAPEGEPPLKIANPEATHEIMVIVLDPSFEPQLDHPMKHHLMPLNYVGQFNAGTNINAAEIVRKTVADVINARLNPDTDALRQWTERFGDSNIKPEFRDDTQHGR